MKTEKNFMRGGRMKIKTSDITVVQKIDYIKLDCPNCKQEILYNYDEFYEEIAEEMCDWKFKRFCCKECGKLIEIEEIHFD